MTESKEAESEAACPDDLTELLGNPPPWGRSTNYVVGPKIAAQEGRKWFAEQWEQNETVAKCPHDVWESVLLGPPAHSRVEEVVRCFRCHCPRCGDSADPDPCMLIRHHREPHQYLSGARHEVGK